MYFITQCLKKYTKIFCGFKKVAPFISFLFKIHTRFLPTLPKYFRSRSLHSKPSVKMH